MKEFFKKFILVIVLVVLCLFLLEAGLRVNGEIPSNMIEGFFVQHGESYRLKKNLDKLIKWPSFTYKAYTNSFGFRDKKTGKVEIEDRKYVIFIGDSATFGNGVDYEKSYAGIVDELATARHGIKVLNLAIGGHHFPDQKELLIEFIESVPQKPLRVFICLTPAFIRSFQQKINHLIVKDGYLFPKNGWLLPYITVFVSNISATYCFLRNNIRNIQAKLQDQDALMLEQLEFYLYRYSKKTPMMADPAIVKAFESFLDSINQYCFSIHAEPVYVFLPLSMSYKLVDMIKDLDLNPDEYDTYFYANLAEEYCKKRQLYLINLKPVLQKNYDKGEVLMFALDAHFNEQTNKIVGEYIYKMAFQ